MKSRLSVFVFCNTTDLSAGLQLPQATYPSPVMNAEQDFKDACGIFCLGERKLVVFCYNATLVNDIAPPMRLFHPQEGIMNKIPQTIIYAKQTGVSITPHERRSEGRATEGRIALRFLRLASGSCSIRFIAEPAEAFALHSKMHKVFHEGGKESLNHRFEGSDGEVKTCLTVERWERNGKIGFAFSVQRGEEQVNVPVPADRFLHAAEFLRHLSLQQAWVEELEPSVG
jgi:hypothetical protein